MKTKTVLALGVLGLAVLGAGFIPVGAIHVQSARDPKQGPATDLSVYSPAPPPTPMNLLFIHHSCGGQMLATIGDEQGENCIYQAHPNGGGLRQALEEQGYKVNEASYGSVIGEHTDLFDWLPKFRTQMDRVLTTRYQDELLPAGQHNNIVVFKSCYPNSNFVGEGSAPGNPAGPELTLANAKATMMALRAEFEKHPDVLFVYVTAPPLAPNVPAQPLWKWLAKKALGRAETEASYVARAHTAREFNDWVKNPDGWLAGYGQLNVVIFDYFDVLTKHGVSDLLEYPTGEGYDSHPSSEGNEAAAKELAPLINRALTRLRS